MNLSEMESEVLMALGESTSNSRYIHSTGTPNYIRRWINRAIDDICGERNWRFLINEATVPIITTSIASSSTGTTLNATSATNMEKNRWLDVTDGTNFERVQVSSRTGNVITLAGSGLTNTYASGYITVNNYFLPMDCGKIINIREWTSPNNLQIVRINQFDRSLPQVSSTGTPTLAVLCGINKDMEGIYTMDATTSTTAIVDTELKAGEDGYYNGWKVTNTTRKGYARVSDYDYDTKTLTLDRAIALQVATDNYKIYPDLEEFRLNPIPIEDITLRIRYRRLSPILVNDYDEPFIPEKYHGLIVYKTLIFVLGYDLSNPRIKNKLNVFAELYREGIMKMAEEYSYSSEDEMESMMTAEDYENDEV